MDLQLTRRGDYVVRAAIALARSHGGGWQRTRDLAAEVDVPLSYAPQILAHLAQAGLVEARAGRVGGYRLTRPPADITLLEVVEAAEGPLGSRRCILRNAPCRQGGLCRVHPAWAGATAAFCDELRRTPLSHVARPVAAA